MLGITCGSLNTVVGIKKGANVDIVLSTTSKRCTPSVVTFAAKNRFYGEEADGVKKSNFKSTIVYPTRCLGLLPNSENFNYE